MFALHSQFFIIMKEVRLERSAVQVIRSDKFIIIQVAVRLFSLNCSIASPHPAVSVTFKINGEIKPLNAGKFNPAPPNCPWVPLWHGMNQ